MSRLPKITFASNELPKDGGLVVLTDKSLTLPDGVASDSVTRALDVAKFEGGKGKTAQILCPADSGLDRLIVLGTGDVDDLNEQDWLNLGGKLQAATGEGAIAIAAQNPMQAVAMAQGAVLASYKFDRYKTKKGGKKDEKKDALALTFHTDDVAAAEAAWESASGIADGVMLARDLVNEPANVLTPKDFAKRAKKLSKLGCKVTALDGKDMNKLKMGALMGVARGSRNPPRMAIIEWNGGKEGEKPVAFVGKGVTFDTGGISLKPPAGMGDMKGDMGGAAAVTGLMHALAARKAKANVVGIIGLVENMPDGDAQRPGDIVTSMSGQTIEVLNTDAEGRLVLADALYYCRKEFDPKFMINLATLTGAILVALGNQHAGLFSNDDTLSEQLSAAGAVTNEKVWRMPLTKEYDKMIDTKNADMKNIGGRFAGSITAAQFLQRYVGDTPWVHLDIAGTAMDSPSTDINKSWASGYGVRLLDRLVADNYES
ncbi:leucyl aminopeptidase [Ahrensia sp. R2A130]|uniref:leucyl aminopeptidase n=1 Tax=Ahrensia sp. R2A130 TaxID=744979 RepID=UPI0001E0942E|nr:leucyl aminopeptidase [Ahrensia sp. R2A130]EFL90591.1 probable cytosol aminopeptidase [Ahrensia sp. R2A130]